MATKAQAEAGAKASVERAVAETQARAVQDQQIANQTSGANRGYNYSDTTDPNIAHGSNPNTGDYIIDRNTGESYGNLPQQYQAKAQAYHDEQIRLGQETKKTRIDDMANTERIRQSNELKNAQNKLKNGGITLSKQEAEDILKLDARKDKSPNGQFKRGGLDEVLLKKVEEEKARKYYPNFANPNFDLGLPSSATKEQREFMINQQKENIAQRTKKELTKEEENKLDPTNNIEPTKTQTDNYIQSDTGFPQVTNPKIVKNNSTQTEDLLSTQNTPNIPDFYEGTNQTKTEKQGGNFELLPSAYADSEAKDNRVTLHYPNNKDVTLSPSQSKRYNEGTFNAQAYEDQSGNIFFAKSPESAGKIIQMKSNENIKLNIGGKDVTLSPEQSKRYRAGTFDNNAYLINDRIVFSKFDEQAGKIAQRIESNPQQALKDKWTPQFIETGETGFTKAKFGDDRNYLSLSAKDKEKQSINPSMPFSFPETIKTESQTTKDLKDFRTSEGYKAVFENIGTIGKESGEAILSDIKTGKPGSYETSELKKDLVLNSIGVFTDPISTSKDIPDYFNKVGKKGKELVKDIRADPQYYWGNLSANVHLAVATVGIGNSASAIAGKIKDVKQQIKPPLERDWEWVQSKAEKQRAKDTEALREKQGYYKNKAFAEAEAKRTTPKAPSVFSQKYWDIRSNNKFEANRLKEELRTKNYSVNPNELQAEKDRYNKLSNKEKNELPEKIRKNNEEADFFQAKHKAEEEAIQAEKNNPSKYHNIGKTITDTAFDKTVISNEIIASKTPKDQKPIAGSFHGTNIDLGKGVGKFFDADYHNGKGKGGGSGYRPDPDFDTKSWSDSPSPDISLANQKIQAEKQIKESDELSKLLTKEQEKKDSENTIQQTNGMALIKRMAKLEQEKKNEAKFKSYPILGMKGKGKLVPLKQKNEPYKTETKKKKKQDESYSSLFQSLDNTKSSSSIYSTEIQTIRYPVQDQTHKTTHIQITDQGQKQDQNYKFNPMQILKTNTKLKQKETYIQIAQTDQKQRLKQKEKEKYKEIGILIPKLGQKQPQPQKEKEKYTWPYPNPTKPKQPTTQDTPIPLPIVPVPEEPPPKFPPFGGGFIPLKPFSGWADEGRKKKKNTSKSYRVYGVDPNQPLGFSKRGADSYVISKRKISSKNDPYLNEFKNEGNKHLNSLFDAPKNRKKNMYGF